MDRTCGKCGRCFKYPSGLKSHNRRITPCAPIVEEGDLADQERQKPFACKFCGRRYKSDQSLWRHVRTRCRIATTPRGMDMLYEHTLERQLEEQIRHNKQLESQQKMVTSQLDHMMKMLSQQNAQVSAEVAAATSTNTVIFGNIYNGPVTQINIFGKENLTHIDHAKVKTLLDNVMDSVSDPTTGADNAFLQTVMMVYSDPDHPENITCYLPNSKKEEVLVHGEGGWEVQPYKTVLPPMVMNSMDTLFRYQPFDGHEKYKELMQALRRNEETYKTSSRVRTMLVRNKNLLERIYGGAPPR